MLTINMISFAAEAAPSAPGPACWQGLLGNGSAMGSAEALAGRLRR
jgi:hypothetical protein